MDKFGFASKVEFSTDFWGNLKQFWGKFQIAFQKSGFTPNSNIDWIRQQRLWQRILHNASFESFHFEVSFRKSPYVTRMDIKDGCTQFSFSVKVSRKFACVILRAGYRDNSICAYDFNEPVLLEERFDLSRISQDLPEELIITIFSDTFLNRKTYLKRISDTEKK